MKKTKQLISLLLCSILIISSGCSSSEPKNDETVSILKRPSVSNYTYYQKPVTKDDLEKVFPKNRDLLLGFDLRSKDLSQIEDLSNYKEQLFHSDFDEKTIWPKNLPDGFNPKEYLEFHKNPGFNLDKLHKEGITGKNVNIAFDDTALLTEHVEYGDRLKYYDEVHNLQPTSHFHGSLVTSIASGKNTGVAPQSDLYFIGRSIADIKDLSEVKNLSWLAKAIDKILEKNDTLPTEDKIRVISLSHGGNPNTLGYSEFLAAIERAKKKGIFVVSFNLPQSYGKDFYFGGVYTDPLKDKNDVNNFKAYPWIKWLKLYATDAEIKFPLDEMKKDNPAKVLLAPMTNKTSAYSSGKNEYVYLHNGGISSAIPFIAGVYCLTCQVYPKITPEEFWKVALETGDPKDIPDCPVKAQGIMINPYKLIKTLQQNH